MESCYTVFVTHFLIQSCLGCCVLCTRHILFAEISIDTLSIFINIDDHRKKWLYNWSKNILSLNHVPNSGVLTQAIETTLLLTSAQIRKRKFTSSYIQRCYHPIFYLQITFFVSSYDIYGNLHIFYRVLYIFILHIGQLMKITADTINP